VKKKFPYETAEDLFFFARKDAKPQRGTQYPLRLFYLPTVGRLCESNFFFSLRPVRRGGRLFFSFLVRQRILSSAAKDLIFYADLNGKITLINAS
jgi:hypothetical protein